MIEVMIELIFFQVIERDSTEPIFGICMGNQLTGLAAGAKSYKLPLGNRLYAITIALRNKGGKSNNL